MARETPTLTSEFKANDPYAWLTGKEGYELPQEWIDNMPVPELHTTRILAPYDEAGYEGSAIILLLCGPHPFPGAFGQIRPGPEISSTTA